jgi:hypothetical protein
MSLDLDKVLSAIGTTESSDFNELCQGLGDDCPAKGDTAAWREDFALIRDGELLNLIKVEREGRSIKSLILTSAGTN